MSQLLKSWFKQPVNGRLWIEFMACEVSVQHQITLLQKFAGLDFFVKFPPTTLTIQHKYFRFWLPKSQILITLISISFLFLCTYENWHGDERSFQTPSKHLKKLILTNKLSKKTPTFDTLIVDFDSQIWFHSAPGQAQGPDDAKS